VAAVERQEQRADQEVGRPASRDRLLWGSPEEVLDAVFDFAEQLIAQQRIFAKQMLRAASRGQETVADAPEAMGDQASPMTPAGSPDAPSTTRITAADFPGGEPGR
jgi:hypothetical protein